MLETGKVSIIVPIYSVEQYMHRCVDSILNQTYANLEIILVNDGSPDDCGRIADDYQKKDQRVQVIHKENGGLSDARNAGMTSVTGEYTMFVDSDDWLEETMVASMVANSKKHQADIVQSAFYYAYDTQLLIDQQHIKESDAPLLLDRQTVMFELVKNEKVKNFAWGKLYKTMLIRDIPFKQAVLFEDVFWAHLVMHNIDRYLIIHQPFYYYYQRDDSIVASYTPKNLDMIKGLKERHQFLQTFYKDLTNVSYKNILKASLIHYNLLSVHKKTDSYGRHRKSLESYIQDNYSQFKQAIKGDRQLRVQLYLFSIHPYLNMAYLGIKKSLRRLRILPKSTVLKRVDI